MTKLKSSSELEDFRKSIMEKRDSNKPCITVCGGTGCHASGSEKLLTTFKQQLSQQKLDADVEIKTTGCHGFCERGPLVVIKPRNIFYQRARIEDVPEIISGTVVKGNIIDRLLYTDPNTGMKISYEDEVPFYKKQHRLVFGSNGYIDPNNIEDYLALGGYAALSKALFEMSPEAIIEEVKQAGLRGRGGGGFPTGIKWEKLPKGGRGY